MLSQRCRVSSETEERALAKSEEVDQNINDILYLTHSGGLCLP